MRAAGKRLRRAIVPVGALLLLGTASVTVSGCGGGGGRATADPPAGRRAESIAAARLSSDPRGAALLAIAADRFDPSVEAEMSMLAVAADSDGVERVLGDGGTPLAAATRIAHLVVGVDRAGKLYVWRPSGVLVGEGRLRSAPIQLAESQSTPLLAAVDKEGRLTLIDLTDPTRPAVHVLSGRVTNGRPLSLTFTEGDAAIAVVTDRGEVEEFDTTTGAPLGRWSIDDASDLPRENRMPPRLGAAAFDPIAYGFDRRLLIATRDGTVARVRLGARQVETLLPGRTVPGRVVALAEAPFEPAVAVASTAGVTTLMNRRAEPKIVRGSFADGVEFDDEGNLRIADREGVAFEEDPSRGRLGRFHGGAALGLAAGTGGMVAIGTGGTVSLLGSQSYGLSVAETPETAFANFDPNDHLVTESGSPGFVYQLETLLPGHRVEDGFSQPDPELRTFTPDPEWWPGEEQGLYLDGAAEDRDFVVAGGQAPTGQGVLLVWDAHSGRPLRRLDITPRSGESLQAGVVSQVLLLPGAGMVAAYSSLDDVVELWSTKTWKYVGSVPVGNLKSLQVSGDESKLLGLEIPDPEGEPGEADSKLVFIGASRPHVEKRVNVGPSLAASWSPDGSRIAVADLEGSVRFYSASGKPTGAAPIKLPSEAVALAWRPDGRELAVSLGNGIVLADPASGAVSQPLPRRPEALIAELEWSPDGRFLAATTIRLKHGETESGQEYEPGEAQLWTLGGARLRRRMCQLVGNGVTTKEWHGLLEAAGSTGGDHPPCGTARVRPLASSPGSPGLKDLDPALAYRSGSRLFVADRGGDRASVAKVPGDRYAQLDAIWAGGRLGWSTGAEVGIYSPGSSRARIWPCACAGAVPDGRSLLALENGGRDLFSFTPGKPLPRTVELSRPLGEGSRLLGVVHGRLIIGKYSTSERGLTHGEIYEVDRRGRAQFLAADGYFLATYPTSESPSGGSLLFASTTPSGDCNSTGAPSVIRYGSDGRLHFGRPPIPFGEEEVTVRSVVAHADGELEAALAPPDCSEGGAEEHLSAARYLLKDGAWSRTGARGFDIQMSGEAQVAIRRARPTDEGGRLTASEPSGRTTEIAAGVAEFWVKP